jgi:hypothetical protein
MSHDNYWGDSGPDPLRPYVCTCCDWQGAAADLVVGFDPGPGRFTLYCPACAVREALEDLGE